MTRTEDIERAGIALRDELAADAGREVRDALIQIERIERALDNAYALIADSLDIAAGKSKVEKRAAVEKRIADKRALVKQYMELNDEREIPDGELGSVAQMSPRNGQPTYNISRASEFTKVAACSVPGLVKVDSGILKKMAKNEGEGWIEELQKLEMPGGVTYALHIERGAK